MQLVLNDNQQTSSFNVTTYSIRSLFTHRSSGQSMR